MTRSRQVRAAVSGGFGVLVLALARVAVTEPALPSLVYSDAGGSRRVSVETLLDGAPPVVVEIEETSPDADAPGFHRYEGVPLARALEVLGVADDAHLELVSTDGFLEDLPPHERRDPRVRGLIAYRDLEAAPPALWVPFEHGGDRITAAPFYLVWTADDAQLASVVAERPWPYALAEIRVVPADDRAAPGVAAPDVVRSGYEAYVALCIRCHAVAGRGGSMGPPLVAPGTYLADFDDTALSARILEIDAFYPDSKMPVFERRLGEDGAAAIIAYLKWMHDRLATR